MNRTFSKLVMLSLSNFLIGCGSNPSKKAESYRVVVTNDSTIAQTIYGPVQGYLDGDIFTGKVITLSGDAEDENTFEMPTKLAPQTSLYGKFGKQFSYEFAPMSFTILRIKVNTL